MQNATKRILRKVSLLLLSSASIINASAQIFDTQVRSVEGGIGSSNYGTMFYGSYIQYFTKRDQRPRFMQSSSMRSTDRKYPCPTENSKLGFLFPKRAYGKISLFYELGRGNGIKYSTTGLDVACFYSLIKIGSIFFINAKGGVTLSSDKLQSSLTTIDNAGTPSQQNFSTLKYGILGGVETELLLSPKMTLITGWDQRYLLDAKETWGTVRWYAYVGLRLNVR